MENTDVEDADAGSWRYVGDGERDDEEVMPDAGGGEGGDELVLLVLLELSRS